MNNIKFKYLTLMLTALIPSVLMGASSYFITLNDKYAEILKSFTAGLLMFSGFKILNDNEDNKTMIISFIVSLFTLFLTRKKNNSLISSLYFDSVSDGLLLGALFNNYNNFKQLIPIIISMTIEMSVTGISAVDELKKEKTEHYKEKVLFSAILLGVSILIGFMISKNINKNIIYGMGSASMLWLSISEFITKLKLSKNAVYIFIGIIFAMFFE